MTAPSSDPAELMGSSAMAHPGAGDPAHLDYTRKYLGGWPGKWEIVVARKREGDKGKLAAFRTELIPRLTCSFLLLLLSALVLNTHSHPGLSCFFLPRRIGALPSFGSGPQLPAYLPRPTRNHPIMIDAMEISSIGC